MKKALIALIGLIGCAIIGGCIAWAINDRSIKIRERYPIEWRVAPNAKVTFNGVSRPDSLVYVSDAGDLLIFQHEKIPFFDFSREEKTCGHGCGRFLCLRENGSKRPCPKNKHDGGIYEG